MGRAAHDGLGAGELQPGIVAVAERTVTIAGEDGAKAAQAHLWTLEERVRARADMGAAVRLAREAVDILADASGGSSIFSDVPIQRIRRDIQALSLHALMHPDTNAELYGRVLCGQPPNTQYL